MRPSAFINSSWQPGHRVLLGLVLWKAGYFLLLVCALAFRSDYDESRAARIREVWFPPMQGQWLERQQTGFQRHFATWDAAHYLVLSEAGYSKELRSCAFYPLWPWTIRMGVQVSGASPVVVGMVLANVLSVVGCWLFWRNTAGRFGEPVANWALVYLVLFPGSLFSHFIYSEPQFFLLLMVLWKGLEARDYGTALSAAFLLPLSRAIGLFTILPILLHAWGRWREVSGGTGQIADETHSGVAFRRQIFREKLAGPALLATAPVLGWMTCLTLMWHWTGDAFQGFSAQEHWRVHSITHLWDVPKFVLGFLDPTSWHEFRGSLLDRCAFILLLLSVPVLWRRGRDLLSWVLILGVVPAMSGTFTSFIRFESVVFPIFMAMGAWSAGSVGGWRGLAVGFASGLAALHIVLVWRFVNHGWAG